MSARSARADPSMEPDGFELEADLIRVLANAKRLRIVALLGSGPRTVTAIADDLDLSLQNTSQHLRLLRDRGIVRAHRNGREVFYALSSPVFSQACAVVRETLIAALPGASAIPDMPPVASEPPVRSSTHSVAARTRAPVQMSR